MSKVRFAALYSVEYDEDLFEHWAAHYQSFAFDSYYVWLHSNHPLNVQRQFYWLDAFRDYGFNCSFVHDEFQAGTLRQRLMRMMHDSLLEGESLVTADSDEIQQVPENYYDMVAESDVVMGRLTDRWADTLHYADPDVSLDVQYPYAGDVWEAAGIETALQVNRQKVLAAKKHVKVNYIGSHNYACDRDVDITGVYKVAHYTWRPSIITRLAGKPYFYAREIAGIIDFFHLPPSDPVLDAVRKRDEEMQKAMGWEVAH